MMNLIRLLDGMVGNDPLIGKKHALKKYNQFAINTSCFWGEVAVKYYPVVQFHEIFGTKIINEYILINYLIIIILWKQKFRWIAQ